MHEALWAGIERKLDNAKFHFEKMGQSLEPPESTHMNVALQAAGAIIDTHWQRSFMPIWMRFSRQREALPTSSTVALGMITTSG